MTTPPDGRVDPVFTTYGCGMDPVTAADLPIDLTYYRHDTIAECDHPVTVTAPLQVSVGLEVIGTTDPVTVCLGCNHITNPEPEDQT